MRITNLILLLSFLVYGCGPISINSASKPVNKTEEVVTVDSTIYDALVADKVTKEDAEILYKNFIGLANYLPHSKKLNNTVKVFQIIKDFQSEYGYEKGKYVGSTDAVEKYLMDAGYKKAKIIIDIDPATRPEKENEIYKSRVVNDIKVIASNCEKYLKGLK